ncbi:MAG: cyclic nucleotide-binding domain-containing protein [Chloroflexota bacterium]|nr:cyclic nucleotide-binding domain-containing protein [Chloroflexota bacterium]
MATIKDVLATSELFKGLTEEELGKVETLSRVEIYEKDTPLFVEGATAENFFVVELGRVAMDMTIHQSSDVVKHVTVETIKNGQSCGFSAVKGTPVYTLTARAVEPVRVIAIDGKRLYNVLQENPGMGYRVMSRMASAISARLRNIRTTIQFFNR